MPKIHDLADLFSQGTGKRAGQNREVLCVEIHSTAIDLAIPGDDTVAEEFGFFHAEIVAAMQFEGIVFLKGTWIEQGMNTLASRFFPFFVNLVNFILTATQQGFGPFLLQLL